jgi:hypothetical protein
LSIVALMQDAAQARRPGRPARRGQPRLGGEERAVSPEQPALHIAAIATELARYVPSEAIGLYTAALPFLLGGDEYLGRWILVTVVAVLAVLFGVGVYRAELLRRGEHFRWPPKRTAIILFAFAAWVILIPGSPFAEFSWYTPSRGAVVGLIANACLVAYTLWFGGPEPLPGD